MDSRASRPRSALALLLGLASGFAFLIAFALGAGVLNSGEAFGAALAVTALAAALWPLLSSPSRARRC